MIKEESIKKNLEKFAFPRLSGTDSELKAFNKVMQEIDNLNLELEVQRFTFSSFYSRIYPKIAFTSGTLIQLLLFLNLNWIILLPIIFILLLILLVSFIITRKPESFQLFFKLNSQNLLVKVKSRLDFKENNERVILFISHLDSKGQRFTINVRIKTIKLWILSSIILTVFLPLKFLTYLGYEIIFYLIGLFPILLNISSLIIIVLNTVNNTSEGAVDNASGIACNSELLKYYYKLENRLDHYNIWFLFTGAEECGTMGVRHFYNNLKNFDVKKSVVFNFESIANHVYLFPGGREGKHAKDIDSLLLNNRRDLEIHHFKTNRVLGAHSDGDFLGNRGFQGYGIGEVEAYSYIHSPNDTIDKINTKVLTKLCLVLRDSLKEHDSRFFK